MIESTPFARRPLVIASAVAALHVGGLAALQSGLLVRAYEMVVPVEMISQSIEPPKPILPPPAPVPPPPPPEPVRVNKAVVLPPAPQPLAIADPTPAPNAPVVTPSPPAPLPPISAPVAASTAPASSAPTSAPAAAAAPPAPRVELPRGDADYLNNPKPPYPPVSKRLAEQGRVVVRVFVGEDGMPQKTELRTSSGYERLDATAVATVMRWRFRPGTRGGQPEAMWINVPIDFKLDN
jgi:periplasmic protein TonB